MTEKVEECNPETVHDNPMNSSISKMLYSFPKSKRFNRTNYLDLPFYTLPNLKSKRCTTFGVGQKSSFEDTKGFPSPDKYAVKREFDKKSKTGFTFSVGRDQIKADSMTVFKASDVPGPGTYNAKPIQKSRSAVVRSRTRDRSLDQLMKVPGPGTYNFQITSSVGKTLNSKYQSARTLIMKRSNSKTSNNQQRNKSPAPWSYSPIIMTCKGERSINKGKGGKFSLSRKQGFISFNKNPGPGQYNSFSEFPK